MDIRSFLCQLEHDLRFCRRIASHKDPLNILMFGLLQRLPYHALSTVPFRLRLDAVYAVVCSKQRGLTNAISTIFLNIRHLDVQCIDHGPVLMVLTTKYCVL